MPTEPTILWSLLAVVTIVAVLALFGWHKASTRPQRASRSRNRIAQTAESDAELLLAEHGFEILERQVEQSWTFTVDGVARRVTCRADLLLEKNSRLFVADVKSGREAPDPGFPSTRRQLLEYVLVFCEVDGVLLVDMTAGKIHELDFSALLERA